MFNSEDFERITYKYIKSLYKYCYYKLYYNKMLTDETVNDIFRVLFLKWDTLNINDNIKAYLYRVADNCIKQTLKKHNYYYAHFESLDGLTEDKIFSDNLYYSDEYFQDDITNDEYIESIKSILSDEYNLLFTYRFIEHKTINEISALTGIPYSSVRLRLLKIESIVRDEIKKIFN